MIHRPPRFAAALYRLCLPPGEEAELGDLVEEYLTEKLPELGGARAGSWFRSQVLRSLIPSLLTPMVRSGWANAWHGLAYGVVTFYGLGLLATVVVEGLADRAWLGVPDAWLFAVYLALVSAGALAAGRLVAMRSAGAVMPTAIALSAVSIAPLVVTVFLGSSAEAALPQLLWVSAIPISVILGARAPKRGAAAR